jgi:hypothetical protein
MLLFCLSAIMTLKFVLFPSRSRSLADVINQKTSFSKHFYCLTASKKREEREKNAAATVNGSGNKMVN